MIGRQGFHPALKPLEMVRSTPETIRAVLLKVSARSVDGILRFDGELSGYLSVCLTLRIFFHLLTNSVTVLQVQPASIFRIKCRGYAETGVSGRGDFLIVKDHR